MIKYSELFLYNLKVESFAVSAKVTRDIIIIAVKKWNIVVSKPGPETINIVQKGRLLTLDICTNANKLSVSNKSFIKPYFRWDNFIKSDLSKLFLVYSTELLFSSFHN